MGKIAIKSHPYISIITINFNNRIGLERTIRSVISQTYSNFEYIIIDGGSSDGSKDVIEKYKNHFSYWVTEPDNGIYHAMNKGVKQAKGEYCLFLNSGDFLCNSQTLNSAAKEIQKSQADFCTGSILVSRNNKICGITPPKKEARFFLFDQYLQHQATFIKKYWLEKTPYPENTRIVGDWLHYTICISGEKATYKPIKCLVSIFDLSGISQTNSKLRRKELNSVRNSFMPLWLYNEIATIISPNVHLFTISKKKYPILFILIKYIKKLRTQPAKYWYKIKYNKKLKESLQACEVDKEN